MAGEENPPPATHDEYVEASALLRHYSSLRFAMLPIYFAVAGALAAYAVGVGRDQPPPVNFQRAASFGAVMITLVFMSFELTCIRYLKHFRERLCELEKVLGYETMSRRPDDHGLVQIASTFLYVTLLLFWIAGALCGTVNLVNALASWFAC